MIILIGGEKGGSGKSCLAQNIAAFLKLVKGRDVLLVDADPQGTTTDWAKERYKNSNLANIPLVELSGKIHNEVADLSCRFEDLVIDTGGHDSEALRSAMTVATHMMLPFRPKRRDLKTLAHCEALISMALTINPNLYARAVISQAPSLPSQTVRILEAKEVCDSFGIRPLEAFTVNRNIYDDADENGSTVIESKVDMKAVTEISGVIEEFFGFPENGCGFSNMEVACGEA